MKTLIDKNIIADPQICHGKPVFKGTRIMVWQILELLKAGVSQKEIYKSYPHLPKNAIKSALGFAAEKTKGIRYVQFPKARIYFYYLSQRHY